MPTTQRVAALRASANHDIFHGCRPLRGVSPVVAPHERSPPTEGRLQITNDANGATQHEGISADCSWWRLGKKRARGGHQAHTRACRRRLHQDGGLTKRRGCFELPAAGQSGPARVEYLYWQMTAPCDGSSGARDGCPAMAFGAGRRHRRSRDRRWAASRRTGVLRP